MQDLDVRLAPLLAAADSCGSVVATQVGVAERELRSADGAPSAARMSGMVSAASARACLDAWQATLSQATEAMHGLGAKLNHTVAIVDSTDRSAAGAEPYLGNAADLFGSQVKSVVDAGHAWSGAGQPQAALVVRANSLALETVRVGADGVVRIVVSPTDGFKDISNVEARVHQAEQQLTTPPSTGRGSHRSRGRTCRRTGASPTLWGRSGTASSPTR